MKHRNRISHGQRRALYASTAVLLGTGLLWLSVHQWAWPAMSRASMEGLPSPWEPWLMKAHGAAMMAMLFLIGRLSATHVMRGLRLMSPGAASSPHPHPHRPGGQPQPQPWRKLGGISLLVQLAFLALTGYGLYYLVPDDWRDATGWVHAAIGVAWVLTLLVHRRRVSA